MNKIKKYVWLLVSCLLLLVILPKTNVQASSRFNVSTTTMKKDILGYTVPVIVNGQEQRFTIKKTDIKKFTVNSKTKVNNKVTVKATVYVDRKVADVKARVKFVYEYKGTKWRRTSIKIYPGTISKINLKGTWKGTYVANQGQTKLVLKINAISKDCYLTSGTFNFSATPTNPNVPSGSYTLKGGYDKSTGKIALYGKKWIKRPNGYNFVNLDIVVNLEEKKLDGNYSLDIKKVK